MYLSARSTFKRGDDGWERYLEFIGLSGLDQIRTIDPGLNEPLEDSSAQDWCTPEQVSERLPGLPQFDADAGYYQLAVNLADEPRFDGHPGCTCLGFDLSDDSWTSTLLNCGKWEGELKKLTERLNRFGLLEFADAIAAQDLLPMSWGEDDPHAFVDIWELWAVDSSAWK